MATHEKDRDTEINVEKVNARAQDIEDKLPKLKQWMEQAKIMLAIAKDYWHGNYREVPYWAISAISLALLYVLNPLDVIPDLVPGFGYLDDATVVAFCLKLLEKEIERYKEWTTTQPASRKGGPGKVVDVTPENVA